MSHSLSVTLHVDRSPLFLALVAETEHHLVVLHLPSTLNSTVRKSRSRELEYIKTKSSVCSLQQNKTAACSIKQRWLCGHFDLWPMTWIKRRNRENHFPSQSLLVAWIKDKTWQETNMKAEHDMTNPVRKEAKPLPAVDGEQSPVPGGPRKLCLSLPSKHWADLSGEGRRASQCKRSFPLPSS